MIGPVQTAWCEANIAALEVERLGPAAHIVQEDQPEAIGKALAAWSDRHDLRAA
jgi:haloalkane dehalogenase